MRTILGRLFQKKSERNMNNLVIPTVAHNAEIEKIKQPLSKASKRAYNSSQNVRDILEANGITLVIVTAARGGHHVS